MDKSLLATPLGSRVPFSQASTVRLLTPRTNANTVSFTFSCFRSALISSLVTAFMGAMESFLRLPLYILLGFLQLPEDLL